MSSEDNKKLCSKHNLEILVIEFKQSNVDEGCIKCLMEKFDTQNIFLVQETKIMIHQMKSDILDKKVKQYLTMIETYQKIQSLIKELSLSITKTLHKVEFNLSSKIQLINDELKNSKQNIQVSSFEEDIKVLLKNQKGPFSFEVPSEFLIPINDNTYIESIQQQLQSIIKCPIFTKIIETLQKLKVKEDHLEINQVQQIFNNQEYPQKKQGLNIQCKKHGKDIIMFNLNPEKTELSRLVCVECISSNDPIKYTTLSDTNQQWNEYLEQTNDNVQQFQNKRCQNQTQIIKILEEIKEKHLSTIQDIMNKINIKFSTNQKNESKQINKNSIYDMNSEQLNGLAKILSNKDKFYDLTEKKYNIQKENYNQLEIISTSFGKLQKKRLKATNKINNIFKEQIINIIEDQVLNEEEDEISNLQSIKQLDLQLKILKKFQDILQEAQIQYESVMQKINILSNQFKNQQLQKFNEYISQFEKDFSIIKKLTCFDQIEAELNLLKENKKIRLIKPTEKEKIILQQQQKIIDFNKHQEEQRLKILDLKNEKEALKAKLKQLEQSKIKIEVNHEEKQEGYERCSQPNQNNEEIVKQLQQTLNMPYNQLLTFSKTYKHSNCQVTQNGKVSENNSGNWYCCMCDQMIPKNGVIQFAFKIIEVTCIMIGIGFRDIVQSKGYYNCFGIGGGSNRTYNIHNSSYCCNHDQQDKNDKKIAFPFQKNDTIIVEVDIQNQYVKWINSSTNQSFTLIIDTSKDLYPCVHFYKRCKIEIIS